MQQSRVFPHIARLGPREGTHIIYASQQSAHRRPQADITDFDKVLYSYLRIEDVPDLLSLLDRQLEEQAEVERQRAKKIDDAETSLRSKLDALANRIEAIMAAPPWPSGAVPTNAETDARIREFAKECGGSLDRQNGARVTREWLLEEAERAIQKQSATGDAARRQLADVRRTLQRLATATEAFRDLAQQLQTAKASVAARDDDLQNVLGDTTKEQRLKHRDELVQQADRMQQYGELVQQAAGYFKEFSPQKCPVCDAGVVPADVMSGLKSRTASDPREAELSKALGRIRAHLKEIDVAEAAFELAKAHRATINARAAAVRRQLEELLDDPADESSIDRTAARLKERVQLLERELNESGTLVASRLDTLNGLRLEARFHQHLFRQQALRRSIESGLEPARRALRQFEGLLETLRTIREALQDSFNSTLNRTLPRINAEMTEVFGRLTQQASFPKVVVEPGPSDATRTLRVRVTSDRTHGQFFQPSEVLNGQAFNALNLVPYFVFSQFQAEALELDCLLIDDPSQSFDTSRVELLMRELATAASHAQLVVASHEQDRFAPLIGKYFPSGSYRVLRVTSFAPGHGPTFEYVD